MDACERVVATAKMRARFLQLKSSLLERARRLFSGKRSDRGGYGGIAAARATGMAPSVNGRGIGEVRAIEAGTAPPLDPKRSRRPGAGRKKTTAKDLTLLPDLRALVEATTRGDPEWPLLWMARSQRNLVDALVTRGHQTSTKMVARLLKELG